MAQNLLPSNIPFYMQCKIIMYDVYYEESILILLTDLSPGVIINGEMFPAYCHLRRTEHQSRLDQPTIKLSRLEGLIIIVNLQTMHAVLGLM